MYAVIKPQGLPLQREDTCGKLTLLVLKRAVKLKKKKTLWKMKILIYIILANQYYRQYFFAQFVPIIY